MVHAASRHGTSHPSAGPLQINCLLVRPGRARRWARCRLAVVPRVTVVTPAVAREDVVDIDAEGAKAWDDRAKGGQHRLHAAYGTGVYLVVNGQIEEFWALIDDTGVFDEFFA